MVTHILSMTYQPKIEGVRNGTIRQTIRPLSKVPRKVGDKLILHGWTGKPYRSPWSWRREEKIVLTWAFAMDAKGVQDYEDNGAYYLWADMEMDGLARFDGISPPMGKALKHVLESYHGKFTDKTVMMQVIRW